MWMTDYIREIQRQFIAVYKFPEDPKRPGLPVGVPDGEYLMTIDGKRDWVRVVDGTICCCNFEGPLHGSR
jgi:hypothetical protein